MLSVARFARSAYRFGPAQNRRSMAGEELRSTFTTTLFGHMDLQCDTAATNAATQRSTDAAYFRTYNWFLSTNPTSAYPLKTSNSNITCLQFDGINDVMSTSNSGTLSAFKVITIVELYRNASATTAILAEMTNDYTAQTTGCRLAGTNASCEASLKGDVGFSTRGWNASQTPWTVNASVLDKSAPLGSEITVYQNATQITAFTTVVNSNNTNDFGTNRWFTGSRSNTGALPLTGQIAQFLVFTTALNATQVTKVTQLVRWHAGLPV